MNRQTVFNKALTHLRAQGKKSSSDDLGCAYRGDDGLKCAIGIFISDSKYSPCMEGSTVEECLILDALPKTVSVTGMDFLADLQLSLHDDLSDGIHHFQAYLEGAASEFAARYGLQYSMPRSVS